MPMPTSGRSRVIHTTGMAHCRDVFCDIREFSLLDQLLSAKHSCGVCGDNSGGDFIGHYQLQPSPSPSISNGFYKRAHGKRKKRISIEWLLSFRRLADRPQLLMFLLMPNSNPKRSAH